MRYSNQSPQIANRYNELVGHRVKLAREERGLSQTALIEKMNGGLQQSVLSSLERGTRRWNLEHLVLVANALGVRVGLLVDPPDDPIPNPDLVAPPPDDLGDAVDQGDMLALANAIVARLKAAP